MKLVFDSPQFSYELLRTVGRAPYGGADVGECLATAYRIKDGDYGSWHKEWLRTADRIAQQAGHSLAGGHKTSAREGYLRASNYYRAAEFFLPVDPRDPRILETWLKSRDCFRKAAELFAFVSETIEPVKIPFEGTTLPGYFMKADTSDAPRPTLLAQTGFDGTAEELYYTGAGALQRNYNCLVFEGPGQGGALREQGLRFRPDWEKVVTPVVDYALSLPQVDPRRVALIGFSMGGYLAPRAAAFDHRISALIADGGVYDFFEGIVADQPESPEDIKAYITEDPAGYDKVATQLAEKDPSLRYTMMSGMWKFGAASPHEWMLKATEYTMKGLVDKVSCPTLIVESEADRSFPGQSKRLYDALLCPKKFVMFTAEDGAEEHCQAGAELRCHQVVFDWLNGTFVKALEKPEAAA